MVCCLVSATGKRVPMIPPSQSDEPERSATLCGVYQELPLLVLTEGWMTLSGEGANASIVIQHQVFAPYLASKRWFAAKGRRIERVEIVESGELKSSSGSWLLTIIEVRCAGMEPQLYFLPLAICWEEEVSEEKRVALVPWSLAKVRQKERVGFLYGAFGDNNFCRTLVLCMNQNLDLPMGKGAVAFRSSPVFGDLSISVEEPVRHPVLEQSNTAVYFGNSLFLKGYRRLQPGTNPEVVVGRFLTEESPFSHSVPVVGSMEFHHHDGTVLTLGLLQSYVENQGTGWNFSVDYLERFLTEALSKPIAEGEGREAESHGYFVLLMQTLGRRTAELHQAFCRSTGNRTFEPEPITPEDLTAWSSQLHAEMTTTLSELEKRVSGLSEELRQDALRLLSLRADLLRQISPQALGTIAASKMRYHGDYHLGQVLLKENDFIITDFEGEPARSMEERQKKHSPLRDVAGMLRSISYVAAMATQHTRTEHPADSPRLALLIQTWWRMATDAFFKSYCQTIRGYPAAPLDAEEMDRLIRFFVMEKALYELRYEMDNRPDWLSIPLQGLLRTLDHRDAEKPGGV